jgi:hypothetical protein
MTEIITLDIEGTIFKTRKETLLRIPYFTNLFTDTCYDNEPIYRDRSARGFSHILNLARDANYKFPHKYKCELDFYNIKYLECKLYEPNDDLKYEIRRLSNKINDSQNETNNQFTKLTSKLSRLNKKSDYSSSDSW